MGMWRKERREGENGEQKVRVGEQVLKREREERLSKPFYSGLGYPAVAR